MEVASASISAISQKDNLQLSDINIPAVPHDIIFPEELNQHLKGKVQFLMHTNGMLQRTISEQESELKSKISLISQLNSKVSEYERMSNTSNTQLAYNPAHLMTAKIVELSKKLKDKTVETESLKTKLSKVQKKLIILENKPPKTDPDLEATNESEQTETKPDLSEEIKTLQEKLSQSTSKLFEIKNNNALLKNEIKAAHKILQQEIGDHFTSVQHLVTTNSHWRGRAQQILSLQQKNSELQEKLSAYTDKEPKEIVPKVDPRKQQIEQLQKEVASLKNELEETKKKLSGSRARVKVLENECSVMRNRVLNSENKNKNDDKLIQLLQVFHESDPSRNQITSMEESNVNFNKEKNVCLKKKDEENKKLLEEVYNKQTMIDNFKKVIEDRDKKINELLEEIQIIKTSYSINRSGVNSAKDLTKLKIMEVEVNRLLELTKVLNTRLEEERLNNNTVQLNYKLERQRAAKLELKLSRLELETSMNNKTNNYSTKSLSRLTSISEEKVNNTTVETLKNKLEIAEENISILNGRLGIVQKEKDLDYQRFSSILSETSGMLLKCYGGQND